MRRSSIQQLVLGLGVLSVAAVAPPEASEQEPGTDAYGVGPWEVEYDSLAPIVTETGPITLSLDASGSNGGPYEFRGGPPETLRVRKPAGATVRRAFLAAASVGFSGRRLLNGDVILDGVGINWQLSTPSRISSWNHWAEVTPLVKPKLDAAAPGIISFSVGEVSTRGIDGEILAVIFNDPAQTTSNTVVLLFGAQDTAGDTFNIPLGNPINKADPRLAIDLSLGISNSLQQGPSPTQRSIVDVNGNRLTSLAGGQDDGQAQGGALITVGGLGASNANPPPFDTSSGPPGNDDELYNLLPFVANGATSIAVFTQNPSLDDNIFFAALSLRASPPAVNETINLGPSPAPDTDINTSFTLTATVQDANGRPVSGRTVTFRVTAGPQIGVTGTATTNAAGHASFTYTGRAAGVDQIQASFVDSQNHVKTSNIVLKRWLARTPPEAICQDVTHAVNQMCLATVQPAEVGGRSFDPDGDPISLALTPPGPYLLGNTTVLLTVTDADNLSDRCTARITAVDQALPTITCPGPRTAECTGNGKATVTVPNATGSDNCGPPAITGPAGTASFPLGTTQLPFVATDRSGNTARCTTSVTVVDTTPPTITCPAPITAECTGGGMATVAVPNATASDICGPVTVTGPAGVRSYPLGTTPLSFLATDAAMLRTSCTTSVRVVDTRPPVFDPASLGPRIVFGNCSGAPVSFPLPTATDSCRSAGVSVTCTPVPGNNFGPTTSICTATDASGNKATATITVNVLQPLRLAFQPPLEDDNVPDDIRTDADATNLFQVGSTVPNKLRVFGCNGADVTRAVAGSVTLRLTLFLRTDGSPGEGTPIVPSYTGVGAPGGVLVLTDDQFQYNLKTDRATYPSGTINNSYYFDDIITATYNVAPGIIAGQEDARLESR
jgi:hypothetical protein